MINNVTIIPNSTMSQSIESLPFSPNENVEALGYAVQAKWTGNPNGTLKLQISMDSTDPACWVDLPDSTINTGAIPGTQLWDIKQARYNFVRVFYTFLGGSGLLELNRSK